MTFLSRIKNRKKQLKKINIGTRIIQPLHANVPRHYEQVLQSYNNKRGFGFQSYLRPTKLTSNVNGLNDSKSFAKKEELQVTRSAKAYTKSL